MWGRVYGRRPVIIASWLRVLKLSTTIHTGCMVSVWWLVIKVVAEPLTRYCNDKGTAHNERTRNHRLRGIRAECFARGTPITVTYKNERSTNEGHKVRQITVVICFDDLILLLFPTDFIEIVKAANDFNWYVSWFAFFIHSKTDIVLIKMRFIGIWIN